MTKSELLECLRRWTFIKNRQELEVDKTQELINAGIEQLEELKAQKEAQS